MGVGLQILIIVVVVVLIAVGAYLGHLQAKKRREALAQLARELGWRFDPSRDTFHDDEYAHFEIFRKGHSRYAFNTLTGTMQINGRPHPAKMGDYHYKVTSGSGKNRRTRTYRFSYLIVQLPFAGVPDLLIRREGIFDKMAGVIGFDDIDFESAEFSRKFFVKSSDKRFAYDVVHPRMMEFLLASPPPAIDLEHGRCCVSDGQRRWKPEQFNSMLSWIAQFIDLWPEHVLADLGGSARSSV